MRLTFLRNDRPWNVVTMEFCIPYYLSLAPVQQLTTPQMHLKCVFLLQCHHSTIPRATFSPDENQGEVTFYSFEEGRKMA
jgi:hypothetical protein